MRNTDISGDRENCWSSNRELLEIGLNECGFSVFCLFAVGFGRHAKYPVARAYADNMHQRYGLFYEQLRAEIVDIPSQERAWISEIMQERSPKLWLYYNAYDHKRAEFFRLPVDYGFPKFKSILTVPFRGRIHENLCLAFSTSLPRKQDVDEALGHIADWQTFLARRSPGSVNAHRLRSARGDKPDILCETELQCLKWAAAGKTLQDISEITGLSYKSVRYNLEKARDKYGFSSMNQTLVQATIDYNLSPYGDDDPGA